MGGKSQTSSQQVSIPPDVLARYNSVNAQAQNVAATPFKQYSSDPNAFVAPVNSTQNAGINQTTAFANAAQPYYGAATTALQGAQAATQPYYGAATALTNQAYQGAQPYQAAATGLASQSAQAVNPGALNVQNYLSPYLQNVAQAQLGLLGQEQGMQMSGELGNVIQSGAFGGDRAGLDLANLGRQQQLASNAVMSDILNTGYNTALGAAQQQQGVGLSAAQANRAALASAGQELAGIGQQGYGQALGAGAQQANLAQGIYGVGSQTAQGLGNIGAGAQGAALQGGQAELGAGQVQQQTSQAGLSALYNQFLQQQSYPFQVSQFLANIAEGTGALSGSTTTTTTPGGLFSDERLKEDIHEVGKLHDGQKVYSYHYKGDHTPRIGLIAQEVERKHPDAVGLAAGYKTVDYAKATAAARRPRRYAGGLVPANDERPHLASGGELAYDPAVMAAILQNGAGMYGPYMAALGGGSPASGPGGPYGGAGRVPAANLPVGHLATAGGLPERPTGLQQMQSAADTGAKLATMGKTISDAMNRPSQSGASGRAFVPNDQTVADTSGGGLAPGSVPLDGYDDPTQKVITPQRRGGRIRRYANGGLAAYDDGGEVDDAPYKGGLGGPHLDIPDTAPNAKLATAGNLPGQGQGNSTGQDMKDIAQMAQAAATVAAMLRRGGRVGKEEGGGLGAPVDPATLTGDPSDFAPPPNLVTESDTALGPEPRSSNGNVVFGASGTKTAKAGQKALAAQLATYKAFGDDSEGSAPASAATQADDAAKGRLAVAQSKVRSAAPNAQATLGNAKWTPPASAAAPAPAHVQQASATSAAPSKGLITPASVYDTSDKYNIVPPYKGGPFNPALYDNDERQTNAGETLRWLNNAGLLGEHLIYTGAGAVANGFNSFLNQPRHQNGAQPQSPQPSNKGLQIASNGPQPTTPQQDAAVTGTGLARAAHPNVVPHPAAAAAIPHGDTDPVAAGIAAHPAGGLNPQIAADMALVGDKLQAGDALPGYSADQRAAMDQLVQANTPQPPSALQRGLGAAQGVGDTAMAGLRGLGNGISHIPLVGPALGAYGSALANKDPATWASLLSGLAAFGAAPTRDFGVALTQGLGGGAQGYLGARQALAATELEQAHATQTLGAAAQNPLPVKDPKSPTGYSYTTANWLNNGAGAQGSTGDYHFLGANGQTRVADATKNYQMATPEIKSQAQAQLQKVAIDAAQAKANITSLNQYADAMSFNDKGFLQPGPFNPIKLALVNGWNDLMRSSGHDLLQVDAQNASEAEIARKMATIQAGRQALDVDQRSLGGLRAEMEAVASGSMNKETALKILSQSYVDNEQKIDRASYYDEFGKALNAQGRPKNWFLPSDVEQGFGNDMNAAHYGKEKDALATAMSNGTFAKMWHLLQTANPQKKAELIQKLDRAGFPMFHRYLTGES